MKIHDSFKQGEGTWQSILIVRNKSHRAIKSLLPLNILITVSFYILRNISATQRFRNVSFNAFSISSNKVRKVAITNSYCTKQISLQRDDRLPFKLTA